MLTRVVSSYTDIKVIQLSDNLIRINKQHMRKCEVVAWGEDGVRVNVRECNEVVKWGKGECEGVQ